MSQTAGNEVKDASREWMWVVVALRVLAKAVRHMCDVSALNVISASRFPSSDNYVESVSQALLVVYSR